MAHNPWTDEMLAKDYHLGSKREAALIARENGNDPAVRCGHCKQMKGFYKGTVGSVVCYGCGSIRVTRYARPGEMVNLTIEDRKVQAKVTSTMDEYEGMGRRWGWCTVQGSEDIFDNQFIETWTTPQGSKPNFWAS